jgi:L,D-peptidoglycan transpeptidase YkuD (ErfK/YbiS/YcfS/YnhG family)
LREKQEKTTKVKNRPKLIHIIMVAVLLAVAGCSTIERKNPGTLPAAEPFIQNIESCSADRISRSLQIIFVTNTDSSSSLVSIYALEKDAGKWRIVMGPIKGNIGRNGFAAFGRKREGDGKTPSGIYPLGTTFGYAPSIDTGMPYRQATKNDYWVDDINSPFYNRWVTGDAGAASVEKMRRDDDLYKYGIVVEYNTNPVVKGYGSAIFFHVRRGEGKPTAGCVSMSEEAIVKLLAWLEAKKKPIAVMGTEAELVGGLK